MGKHRISDLGSVALLLFALLADDIWARPTTPYEAELAVTGWLADNNEPLGIPLGREIVAVETVADDGGEILYYLARLSPSGFVIVPADDEVEPILTFTDAQDYDPSTQDPLTALVTQDVRRRLAEAYAGPAGPLQAQSVTAAQVKWCALIGRAGSTQTDFGVFGKQTISDVRVAPFVKSCWSQGEVCSHYTYNYYTPNHYVAGCAATAMAQLLFYHRYPVEGVGRHPFTIRVLDVNQVAYTRGGNGSGGPYRWDDMVAAPDCSTTAGQRAAIGALCYDVGVAAQTEYGPRASSTDSAAIVAAFKEVLGFSNAIRGANDGATIGDSLTAMINPNIDARNAVILGIRSSVGHAVVVDGYGYDQSGQTRTLYHHLNMGWAGRANIWYNLPDILDFEVITTCIYNVFTEGKGEIISGRVVDAAGRPLAGAAVTATRWPYDYVDATDDKGLYALVRVPSATTFSLRAEKPGFTFTRQTITTGTSRDRENLTGNRWAVDFTGRPVAGD